ncbi:MAG: AglZ/HisF2 family acetamidino modification protein [Planctomycetota bacterium]|jgi:cyclase
MQRIRVIPTLLLDSNQGLVKTIRFGKRTYIGDPINAVKIFNDRGVDELILLDIDATNDGREPNYPLIEDIVSEAFMPVAYGGGIQDRNQMARLLRSGLEKVIVSSSAITKPELIRHASDRFGAQSVVVCLDVKKTLLFGNQIFIKSGKQRVAMSPCAAATQAESLGAGEILVYSMDRDGTFQGFDIDLVRSVASSVKLPVIACGGARNLEDIVKVVCDGKASAVAAGSMFVYQGAARGVLISYPSESEMSHVFEEIAKCR